MEFRDIGKDEQFHEPFDKGRLAGTDRAYHSQIYIAPRSSGDILHNVKFLHLTFPPSVAISPLRCQFLFCHGDVSIDEKLAVLAFPIFYVSVGQFRHLFGKSLAIYPKSVLCAIMDDSAMYR